MTNNGSDAVYDVAIIGGGAAGLQAGLVLARARRRIVLLDAGEPRNRSAEHLQGFLSRDGLPPGELLAAGRAEIARYGADLLAGAVKEVTDRRSESPAFLLALDDERRLAARRVIVATGLSDELPAVPGVSTLFGRDVHVCPYCHGWEVRDQPIGVLGGTDRSVHQALLVRQWSVDVTFFPHTLDEPSGDDGDRLLARGIGVVPGVVRRLAIDSGRLLGVELDDGVLVPRTALFVAPRFVAHDALLGALGCDSDGDGRIVVDDNGRTSVPGVWAAGNVVDPMLHLIGAAAAGSRAAVAVNTDLIEEDIQQALQRGSSAPATR